MQKAVNGQPVRTVRQCLFDQPANPAQVAFESAQFNPCLLVFQTWDEIPKAHPFAERGEGQPRLAG
jgi:hypothetical protein